MKSLAFVIILSNLIPLQVKAEEKKSTASVRSADYAWKTLSSLDTRCYDLNRGLAVNDSNCEQISPSIYKWGAVEDMGYCYKYNSENKVLNKGFNVDEKKCEDVSPSHFDWKELLGKVSCYKLTSKGLILNDRTPVAEENCDPAMKSVHVNSSGRNLIKTKSDQSIDSKDEASKAIGK